MVKNPFIYIKKYSRGSMAAWCAFFNPNGATVSLALEFMPGQPVVQKQSLSCYLKINALQKENEVICRRVYSFVRLQDRIRCLPNSGCCGHAFYRFPYAERLSGMLPGKAAVRILCEICPHRRRFVVAPGIACGSGFKYPGTLYHGFSEMYRSNAGCVQVVKLM